jgi:hypothetical protein
MPALGAVAAQPLRFLDYLIFQPVRAVLLHGAGVPVLVPAPERYAIHKLIVASRRRHDKEGSAKSRKDLIQAETLMQALIEQRQSEAIAEAYAEAWERGPAWRDAISGSMRLLDERKQPEITAALALGAKTLGFDAAELGLARG